jgi:uncharacterized protein YbcI
LGRARHSVAPSARSGDVRTELSDGLVALLKDYYGRGPDRTKTYVNDDLVVCLLRGSFTRVEQTLLEEPRRRRNASRDGF